METLANAVGIVWALVLVIWVLTALSKRAQQEYQRTIEQHPDQRRSRPYRMTRSEALDNFIAKHEQALARKRRQLVQRDAYGIENIEAWNKEKKYFINTVLIPKLVLLDDLFRSDRELLDDSRQKRRDLVFGRFGKIFAMEDKEARERLYAEFDEAVERGAQRGLASMPSFTIADITNGHEYERFCADLLSENGWEARVTKATGDQGVDIIAHYNGLRVVFQCKFYSSPVGNKAVQEVVTARIHEQADLAVVISNATYTRSAENLAKTTNTILIHHDDIPALKETIKRLTAEPESPAEDTAQAKSWRPQIQIDGKWLGNGFRFSSEAAALKFAERAAARRAYRGDRVGGARAVATSDPPNQSEDA
jgi:restriction system protein